MCGCMRWIKSEACDALESEARGGKYFKTRGGYGDD